MWPLDFRSGVKTGNPQNEQFRLQCLESGHSLGTGNVAVALGQPKKDIKCTVTAATIAPGGAWRLTRSRESDYSGN
jgi:hypothetical protein